VPGWGAPRSAASALLLARLGAERGVPPQTTLAGTGLRLDDLREPGREVSGDQELQVLRNLQRACDDPALPVDAGRRYHLTTYGIWGFALASSPTVRDALAVGLRFVDLSFAFCALEVQQDDELRLCLDDRGVPDDVAEVVLSRFSDVGLVDDALFAQMWVTSRHRGRGLAGRALSQELRRKGVEDDVVREAVAGLDPDEEAATARSLVDRKLRGTRGLATDARVRRLAGMLARKGYAPGLAYRVVKEALAEEGADPAPPDTDDLAWLED